jgi:hypothetical protein
MRKQPKLTEGNPGFTNKHGERVITGSYMGRTDDVPEEGKEWPKLRLFKMQMSPCGAYDSGGTYWGAGNNFIGYMYRACDSKGQVVNLFIRARERQSAKDMLQARYPQATFIR